MLPSKVDLGLQNPELEQGTPAVFQFRYTMNTPFTNVCAAFLAKYNWESAQNLTTIDRVEQLDDDRVVIYRRHDRYDAPVISFEQILLNRQNQSIEADVVGRNPNGSTFSVAKTVIRPNLATKAAQSLIDQFVYDVQGQGVSKLEVFKSQVVRLQRAVKFSEWAAADE